LIQYALLGTIGTVFSSILLFWGFIEFGDLSAFVRAGAHLYGLIKIIFLLGHGLIYIPKICILSRSLANRKEILWYNVGLTIELIEKELEGIRYNLICLFDIRNRLEELGDCGL
jgi:hypothetical protein